MYFKTIFFAILILIAAAAIPAVFSNAIDDGVINSQRKSRLNGFLYDLFTPRTICTGCPQHYCDTDPGIILGYCCGCRRALDILPIYCPPNLFCPTTSILNICHDYEYMLNCCC